jgi:ACS family glucarate transporter-like MFS transporter
MRDLRWLFWLGVVFPLTFFMSMDRVNIAVTAPIIAQIHHFTLLQETVILTSFSIFYAAMQIPGGLFAERVGARKGLGAASAWWSLFTILTPFGGIYYGFVAIRSLLGVGQAADWPASVYAINTWFKKEEQSQANSILLGGLYFGTVVGAIITGYISATIGWPWAFYIFGLLGFATSWLWWYYFRDHPRDSRLIPDDLKNQLEEQHSSNSKTQYKQWKTFLRSYQFWAIGVEYLFLIMIQAFYTTLLPTYLYTYRHVKIATVGELTSLPWLSLFIMVFIVGYLQRYTLRKTNSVYKSRVPYAVGGFVVAILFLYLAMQQINVYYAIGLMMVSMAGIGMVQVSIWSACQDLGREFTASVTGWVNMWGNSAGALGPLFTAFLVGFGHSFTSAVTIVGLSGIAGIVLWLFVNPQKPLIKETSTEAMGGAFSGRPNP